MSPIHVRRATPEDAKKIGEISVLCWRYAYAHILPPDYLAALSMDQRGLRTAGLIKQGTPYWVAEQGETVFGFASVGPNSDATVPADGELKAIYLLPQHHGKGVGKALLRDGADYLSRQGFTSLCAFAFRDNSIGEAFYKSVGAEVHSEAVYNIEGTNYPDRAYFWPSLDELLVRLSAR